VNELNTAGRTPDELLTALVEDAARLAKRIRPEIPAWLADELTIGQLRLLGRLANHGPTSMGAIGEWLGVGLPSVTGTVERLERRGLVERRHSADDRRVVEVHLTALAGDALGEMAGVRLEALRAVVSVLDPDELQTLRRLFQTIIARLEEPSA
jgi:DNA-binding MarR family transcriptional regulator